MKELDVLKDNIKCLIEEYFDRKVCNFDWNYDMSAKNEYEDIVKECVGDVFAQIEGYTDDADDHLREVTEMYAPKRPTDEDMDWWFRQKELIEEARRL